MLHIFSIHTGNGQNPSSRTYSAGAFLRTSCFQMICRCTHKTPLPALDKETC